MGSSGSKSKVIEVKEAPAASDNNKNAAKKNSKAGQQNNAPTQPVNNKKTNSTPSKDAQTAKPAKPQGHGNAGKTIVAMSDESDVEVYRF
jgi:hypothetical protein